MFALCVSAALLFSPLMVHGICRCPSTDLMVSLANFLFFFSLYLQLGVWPTKKNPFPLKLLLLSTLHTFSLPVLLLSWGLAGTSFMQFGWIRTQDGDFENAMN
ncbi:hypothetical protein BO99DRAFT_196251 [Aspergillus violaceofuscus CBS 115571]|uniref:Uncharacterized protein n=1 Tax=Aspergillus violaceofuscus (strain CBS 115571) TaxID=1450538 RepID=A0A2V5H8I3_ASPV1|nr:hypothetical protein BO99DRAFT_196251 [Aspergillus violaceofuscus CBS 115571]